MKQLSQSLSKILIGVLIGSFFCIQDPVDPKIVYKDKDTVRIVPMELRTISSGQALEEPEAEPTVFPEIDENNERVTVIPIVEIERNSEWVDPKSIPQTKNWYIIGGGNMRNHLIKDHGVREAQIEGWGEKDLSRLHSYLHNGNTI